MSFFHSIKFRFTLWYLMILGVLLVSLSFGVYYYVSRSLYENLDDTLRLRAVQIQTVPGALASIREGAFEEKVGEIVLLYFYSGDQLVTISRRAGDVPSDPVPVEGAFAGKSTFTTVRTAAGQEMRLYIAPFPSAGSAPMPGRGRINPASAALAVGRPTKEIEDALDSLVNTLLVAVPLAMAVAGAGGIFLARRALKPVDDISRTALEIEEKDLSRRIPVKTKDELGRLAATLNQMIERLERAFKRQREFTGDASHELRTPLSVIQAEASLALQKERSPEEYRESLATISEEARHMGAIIEELLTLARADSGTEKFVFDTIDLGELLRGVAADGEVLCQEKGLRFQTDAWPSIRIRGDRAKLRQLFLNLLDNAVKYTPAGGTVSISASSTDREAVVTVRDTGMGIPPEHLPHIFERFYRVDKARSRAEGGAGLGLAIALHIARSHGGTITVESELGKGSAFHVHLPL